MATDLLGNPEELAVWLGVPADNPRLLLALRNATRRFRGAVRHPVTLVEEDEIVIDGSGRESVLLPVWPVTAVASVTLDGEELEEGTDYAWSADGTLRRLGCQVWPDRLRCIGVVYSHGWATVPDDIEAAVGEQARAGFQAMPGIKQQAVGGQSVTFDPGVTADWTACVARYAIRPGSEP